MQLEPLTEAKCEIVRHWRNQCRYGLRTPHMLTELEQRKFYETIVCNPQAPHRYWAITNEDCELVGMGGLTYIQWENRLAEISIIMVPHVRGKGQEAVALLLEEGFEQMGLKTICGECYSCNVTGLDFWMRVCERYSGQFTLLPNRKFWAGAFWGSTYFSIDAAKWRATHEPA